MTPTWQATMKSNQQSQQVQVQKPLINSDTPLYGKFLVYTEIHYTIFKQIHGQPTMIFNLVDKVTLQSTSPSPQLPNETTGWQVIDWTAAGD